MFVKYCISSFKPKHEKTFTEEETAECAYKQEGANKTVHEWPNAGS